MASLMRKYYGSDPKPDIIFYWYENIWVNILLIEKGENYINIVIQVLMGIQKIVLKPILESDILKFCYNKQLRIKFRMDLQY